MSRMITFYGKAHVFIRQLLSWEALSQRVARETLIPTALSPVLPTALKDRHLYLPSLTPSPRISSTSLVDSLVFLALS